MVSPDAGNFVKQWFGRMGIVGNIQHRKVTRDVGLGQRSKGNGDKAELQNRGAGPRSHPGSNAPIGAIHGDDGLPASNGQS